MAEPAKANTATTLIRNRLILTYSPHSSEILFPNISYESDPTLEFIAKRELHHPRIREQPRVGAKISRVRQRRRIRVHVESREIADVEHFPAKLHAVPLFVRHVPPLTQRRVQSQKSISTNCVAASRLSWVSEFVRAKSRTGLGEQQYTSVWALGRTTSADRSDLRREACVRTVRGQIDAVADGKR